jgi:Rad3-related DNA helicase
MRELRKDEDLFGLIKCFRVSPSCYPVTRAFVHYADENVHEEVIRYYRNLKPVIYGNTLIFEPSHRIIEDFYHLGKHDSIKEEFSQKRVSLLLKNDDNKGTKIKTG